MTPGRAVLAEASRAEACALHEGEWPQLTSLTRLSPQRLTGVGRALCSLDINGVSVHHVCLPQARTSLSPGRWKLIEPFDCSCLCTLKLLLVTVRSNVARGRMFVPWSKIDIVETGAESSPSVKRCTEKASILTRRRVGKKNLASTLSLRTDGRHLKKMFLNRNGVVRLS